MKFTDEMYKWIESGCPNYNGETISQSIKKSEQKFIEVCRPIGFCVDRVFADKEGMYDIEFRFIER